MIVEGIQIAWSSQRLLRLAAEAATEFGVIQTREERMEYKQGDRVRHPIKEEWGLGQVLANSSNDSVRVFFVGAGEKKLLLRYVEPEKVAGDEAAHPVLDNLNTGKSAHNIKYRSLPDSIEFFLELFPEGFYGDDFKEEERDYKVRAHHLARESLGKETCQSLLGSYDYGEIAKRAIKLAGATNLIFPNEKMSLKDGLARESAQEEFSIALYSLLYGEARLEQRFITFSRVLENIGAAKWTTASYFLFVVHPSDYMFVKPTISQYSAELCGFEINYKPRLNWLTYKSVLSFSEYLFSELSELKPRDMIDVQSFMWCIAPGKY